MLKASWRLPSKRPCKRQEYRPDLKVLARLCRIEGPMPSSSCSGLTFLSAMYSRDRGKTTWNMSNTLFQRIVPVILEILCLVGEKTVCLIKSSLRAINIWLETGSFCNDTLVSLKAINVFQIFPCRLTVYAVPVQRLAFEFLLSRVCLNI